MSSIYDAREDKSRRKPWIVRWRDPQGHQRSKAFRTEREAQQYRARIDVQLDEGDYVAPSGARVRFGDHWDRYREMTAKTRRPSTEARDESYYRSMIAPTFATVPLGQIDYLMVQSWVNDLQAESIHADGSGRSAATVHKAYQLLSKAMSAAAKARLVRSNPCADVELPRIEVERPDILTHEDVALLAATIDPRYSTLVLLAAYSGLRIGEVIALRRSAVDVLRSTVEVRATAVEVNGHIVENPPKTRAGRRTVPIPRFVTDALVEQIHGLGPDDLVFTSPLGTQMRQGLFRRRFFTPAVEAAGLAPRRIHDLRHTAVSFWIDAGASPTEIAARAGHRSVVTVLDRYGHLLPSTEDKVTDALDARARAAVDSVRTRSSKVVPIRRAVGD